MANNIDRIIKISIEQLPKLATGVNVNNVMLITSQQGALNSVNRVKSYSTLNSVATDFGSYSSTYQHASRFFDQVPNSVSSNGIFYIGYYRATNENVPATAGQLLSKQLNEINVISNIQGVSDGKFQITIDGGTAISASALNFTNISSMNDIATILNDAIAGATVVYKSASYKFIITSDTTGVSSSVSFVSDDAGTSGSYIGDLLGLSNGSGAVQIAGADAQILTPESKIDALNVLRATVGFKGSVLIDKPTDIEVESIASWGQANDVIFYDVFSDVVANLTKDINTNICWKIKQQNFTKYRCLFELTNDRTFATAYMSRAHTVDFTQSASAISMQLKTLNGIVPQNYTDDQQNSMNEIGLDYYTSFSNVNSVVSTGGNDYWDIVYNILSIKQDLQINLFNVLKGTETKLGFDDNGINNCLSSLEETSRQYKIANVLGTGLTWNSTERFGNSVKTFDNSIFNNGYYWYSIPANQYTEAERQARKIKPQGALKFDGAIHGADVTVIVED